MCKKDEHDALVDLPSLFKQARRTGFPNVSHKKGNRGASDAGLHQRRKISVPYYSKMRQLSHVFAACWGGFGSLSGPISRRKRRHPFRHSVCHVPIRIRDTGYKRSITLTSRLQHDASYVALHQRLNTCHGGAWQQEHGRGKAYVHPRREDCRSRRAAESITHAYTPTPPPAFVQGPLGSCTLLSPAACSKCTRAVSPRSGCVCLVIVPTALLSTGSPRLFGINVPPSFSSRDTRQQKTKRTRLVTSAVLRVCEAPPTPPQQSANPPASLRGASRSPGLLTHLLLAKHARGASETAWATLFPWVRRTLRQVADVLIDLPRQELPPEAPGDRFSLSLRPDPALDLLTYLCGNNGTIPGFWGVSRCCGVAELVLSGLRATLADRGPTVCKGPHRQVGRVS